MQVEHNAALLVINYLAKILDLQVFLQKEMHIKIFVRFPESALVKLNPQIQQNPSIKKKINKEKTKQSQI